MGPPMKHLLAVLLLLAALPAPAGPRDWQVDLDIRAMDRVLVPRGAAQDKAVWYCVYRLTNRTGSDRDLALRLFAQTDVTHGAPARRKSELHADAVDPAVQRIVEGRLGVDPRQPLLDAVRMQGRVREGEQKDGIAVFGEISAEADVIDVFVVGLSAAGEQSRIGKDYQDLIKSGTPVYTVQRAAAGEYSFFPLARRITPLEFKDMTAAGKITSLHQTVSEAEGKVLYALDDARLTETAPKRYLERMVLRLRYRRAGDERKPQLDVYRAEGREAFLAVEPLPANP